MTEERVTTTTKALKGGIQIPAYVLVMLSLLGVGGLGTGVGGLSFQPSEEYATANELEELQKTVRTVRDNQFIICQKLEADCLRD